MKQYLKITAILIIFCFSIQNTIGLSPSIPNSYASSVPSLNVPRLTANSPAAMSELRNLINQETILEQGDSRQNEEFVGHASRAELRSSPHIQKLHINARSQAPISYGTRFPVPDQFVSWHVDYSGYAPHSYVSPGVLQKDYTLPGDDQYADPASFEQVLTDIQSGKREPMTSFLGEIRFDPNTGLPLNPMGRTGIQDRGILGKYGPNHVSDALVTRVGVQTGKLEALVVRHANSAIWLVPGGFRGRVLSDGRVVLEDSKQAALREFAEETELHLPAKDIQVAALPFYEGYVDSTRNTDNAWVESTVWHFHISDPRHADQLVPIAGDDVVEAKWIPIDEAENMGLTHGEWFEAVKKMFNQSTGRFEPLIRSEQLSSVAPTTTRTSRPDGVKSELRQSGPIGAASAGAPNVPLSEPRYVPVFQNAETASNFILHRIPFSGMVSIDGLAGSGKSTFTRMIAGQLKQAGKEVEIVQMDNFLPAREKHDGVIREIIRRGVPHYDDWQFYDWNGIEQLLGERKKVLSERNNYILIVEGSHANRVSSQFDIRLRVIKDPERSRMDYRNRESAKPSADTEDKMAFYDLSIVPGYQKYAEETAGLIDAMLEHTNPPISEMPRAELPSPSVTSTTVSASPSDKAMSELRNNGSENIDKYKKYEKIWNRIYQTFPHLRSKPSDIAIHPLRSLYRLLWLSQLTQKLYEFDELHSQGIIPFDKAVQLSKEIFKIETALGLRDEKRKFRVGGAAIFGKSDPLTAEIVPYRYLEPTSVSPQVLFSGLNDIELRVRQIRKKDLLPVIRILGKPASGISYLTDHIQNLGSFGGVDSEQMVVVDDKLLWQMDESRTSLDFRISRSKSSIGLVIADNSWWLNEIKFDGVPIPFEAIDVWVGASDQERWRRMTVRDEDEDPAVGLDMIMKISNYLGEEIMARYLSESPAQNAHVVIYSDELIDKINAGLILPAPLVKRSESQQSAKSELRRSEPSPNINQLSRESLALTPPTSSTTRAELRKDNQRPKTLDSSLVMRDSWLGTATRTASSTDVNLTSTTASLASTRSIRTANPLTPSAMAEMSFRKDSTSAPTSLAVNSRSTILNFPFQFVREEDFLISNKRGPVNIENSDNKIVEKAPIANPFRAELSASPLSRLGSRAEQSPTRPESGAARAELRTDYKSQIVQLMGSYMTDEDRKKVARLEVAWARELYQEINGDIRQVQRLRKAEALLASAERSLAARELQQKIAEVRQFARELEEAALQRHENVIKLLGDDPRSELRRAGKRGAASASLSSLAKSELRNLDAATELYQRFHDEYRAQVKEKIRQGWMVHIPDRSESSVEQMTQATFDTMVNNNMGDHIQVQKSRISRTEEQFWELILSIDLAEEWVPGYLNSRIKKLLHSMGDDVIDRLEQGSLPELKIGLKELEQEIWSRPDQLAVIREFAGSELEDELKDNPDLSGSVLMVFNYYHQILLNIIKRGSTIVDLVQFQNELDMRNQFFAARRKLLGIMIQSFSATMIHQMINQFDAKHFRRSELHAERSELRSLISTNLGNLARVLSEDMIGRYMATPPEKRRTQIDIMIEPITPSEKNPTMHFQETVDEQRIRNGTIGKNIIIGFEQLGLTDRHIKVNFKYKKGILRIRYEPEPKTSQDDLDISILELKPVHSFYQEIGNQKSLSDLDKKRIFEAKVADLISQKYWQLKQNSQQIIESPIPIYSYPLGGYVKVQATGTRDKVKYSIYFKSSKKKPEVSNDWNFLTVAIGTASIRVRSELRAAKKREFQKLWIQDVLNTIRIRRNQEKRPRSVRDLKTYVRQALQDKMTADPVYRDGVEEELLKLDITAHNPIYAGNVHVFNADLQKRSARLASALDDAQRFIKENHSVDLNVWMQAPERKVLDIGFGGNYHELKLLAERFPNAKEIHGIDIYSKVIQIAKRELRKSGISKHDFNRIHLQQANAEDLSEEFPDNSVDLIVASKSLDPSAFEDAVEIDEAVYHGLAAMWLRESSPETHAIVGHMIDEVYRVLKPGGFGIIYGPSLPDYMRSIGFQVTTEPYGTSIVIRKPSQIFRTEPSAQSELRAVSPKNKVDFSVELLHRKSIGEAAAFESLSWKDTVVPQIENRVITSANRLEEAYAELSNSSINEAFSPETRPSFRPSLLGRGQGEGIDTNNDQTTIVYGVAPGMLENLPIAYAGATVMRKSGPVVIFGGTQTQALFLKNHFFGNDNANHSVNIVTRTNATTVLSGITGNNIKFVLYGVEGKDEHFADQLRSELRNVQFESRLESPDQLTARFGVDKIAESLRSELRAAWAQLTAA